MKIFAHHAHVFPESVRKEATIDRLLRLMEHCDIEGAICFAPFSYQVEGTGILPNRWLADSLEGKRGLYGFGTIDFQSGNLKEQVKEIVDLGFKGIKLHPASQKFNILSEQAFEVYEAAQAADLMITFHTGVHWHRIKDYAVVYFDEIAYHFPRLKFSLEHVGGYHFFNEALAVIVNNGRGAVNNVYAGLTSVFTRSHNRFWYLDRDRLQELKEQVGTGQLIFGLDFPYNLEEDTLLGIETIKSLAITTEEQENILGGNLRRILNIPEESY